MSSLYDNKFDSTSSGSNSSGSLDPFLNPIDALRKLEDMMSKSSITLQRTTNKSIVDNDELYVIQGNIVNHTYMYLKGLRDRVLLVVSQLDPDNPFIWKQMHTFSVINEVLLELSKVVKLQDMVDPENMKKQKSTTKSKQKSTNPRVNKKQKVTSIDSLETLLQRFKIETSGSLGGK